MAEVTASMVMDLRSRTGLGMMECKKALTEAGGDMAKAEELLRIKSGARASKAAERVAAEGVIGAYLTGDGKTGAMVEVNCETDFVARNEDFVAFARDVAAHIAAAAPRWVSRDDVPDEARDAELRIFEQEAADRPEEIRARIAEGKLAKWYSDVVLLDQQHVNTEKHEGRTIGELCNQIAATTGENVMIRRFARFGIGD